jgi:hypothetical protein
MEESPSARRQRRRLESSRISAGGFLGSDPRPLDEIIATDQRALEKTGVGKDRLVTALHGVYATAKKALGGEVDVMEGVGATYYESMGRIPSPFRGDGVFEKGEAVVREHATGRQLVVTSLGIALIEKHDFFQGRGSRYRIDPVDVVSLLRLSPNG